MRILLSKSGNVISRGIRWFTRGEWSHASLLFDSDHVIEAVYPRVRTVSFKAEYPDPKQYQIFWVDVTDEQLKSVLKYASAQIGKPYDLKGDWHFFTRQNYESQPDTKWFCSELVYESFHEAGIDLFSETRGWQVWPDLLKRSTLAISKTPYLPHVPPPG